MPVDDHRDQEIAANAALRGAVLTIFGVLVFAAVLYYDYKIQISPDYAYQGLAFRPPDPWGVFLSVALTSVTALSLPRKILRPSHFILWVLFIFAAAPAILISQYLPFVTGSQANMLGLNVSATLVLTRVLASVRPSGIVPKAQSSTGISYWLALGIISLLIYTVLIVFVGLRVRFLSLTDVYSVRADFSTAALGVPLLGYLLPLQQGVINPIFIARGLYGRRLLPLAAGIGGQLLIYTSTGQKTVLFSIAAIPAVAWLFRYTKAAGVHLLLAVTVASLLALAVDKVTNGIVLTSLFLRRSLVVPGVLTAAYVAVFTNRPKTNFADSFLPFLADPYSRGPSPTHIVGGLYLLVMQEPQPMLVSLGTVF